MNDVNTLLLRVKYALESLDAESRQELVNHIELFAAGRISLNDFYMKRDSDAKRFN